MKSEIDTDGFLISLPNTLGIELELQLIDPFSRNLVPAAPRLLESLVNHKFASQVKPEITTEMIEVNSSIHVDPRGLLLEMHEIRDSLCKEALKIGIELSGGGIHPFARWQNFNISSSSWCQHLEMKYGYLARKNTVFGLHVHVGVTSGDESIALTRKLLPYIPHLIALSASSPFFEGVDTAYDSCRPHGFGIAPTTGYLPENITTWREYKSHISFLMANGWISSQKELYWDIRPKEEFGTVEIRICDTPLTVERACQVAAFCQALCLSVSEQPDPGPITWIAYNHNYFQASRFGLDGSYLGSDGKSVNLRDHLYGVFEAISPIASRFRSTNLINSLWSAIKSDGNDSAWLRRHYKRTNDLAAVVACSAELFRGE